MLKTQNEKNEKFLWTLSIASTDNIKSNNFLVSVFVNLIHQIN